MPPHRSKCSQVSKGAAEGLLCLEERERGDCMQFFVFDIAGRGSVGCPSVSISGRIAVHTSTLDAQRAYGTLSPRSTRETDARERQPDLDLRSACLAVCLSSFVLFSRCRSGYFDEVFSRGDGNPQRSTKMIDPKLKETLKRDKERKKARGS
mmetsp:Transcript_45793/g.90180  ORF Transcript_45793/g.90180 Transcript_45793/m.90180 type:complete len:152 (+) Transcript_45793:470-925(+)